MPPVVGLQFLENAEGGLFADLGQRIVAIIQAQTRRAARAHFGVH